MGMRDIVLAV